MYCCSGNGLVYLAYLIGWRLVTNLIWVCPKICCILASGLENRGDLDTLNNICFHLKTILKSGQLHFGKRNTLLHSSYTSVPAGYLGLGLVAFPGSWKPIGITGACFSCCSFSHAPILWITFGRASTGIRK